MVLNRENSTEMNVAPHSVVGKKLLILDGSRLSLELVEAARNVGIRPVVTDYSDTKDSPAKLAADEYFDVNSADVDAVVELIEREQIDGVMTGYSDKMLPYYARICERAGLPSYATEEQLRLFTDKAKYKRLCREFGVPTIESFSLDEALSGSIPERQYPLLVKPSDGSGSRGVTKCDSPGDLPVAIEHARGFSLKGDVVVERYVEGEEATVFWVFQDGEYIVSVVANRHMRTFLKECMPLPVAYSAPSYLTHDYLAEIAPNVKRMLSSVGVRNGIMFMQGLVEDRTFKVYDIGFRPTAVQEYRFVKDLCGYNPMEMLVSFAVSGSMGEPELFRKANTDLGGYGYNVSTLMMPGTVASFGGLREVASMPGVLSVAKAREVGDNLPSEALGQLRQIAVRVVGTSPSKEAVKATISRITELVEVIGSDGSDLTIPGILLEELDHGLL